MALEARELTILQRVAAVLRTVNGTGDYHIDLSTRVAIINASEEQQAATDLPLVLVLQQSLAPGEGDEVFELEVAISVDVQPTFWVARSWTPEQAIMRLHSDCMRALRAYRGLELGGTSPLWGNNNSAYRGSNFRDPESDSVIAGFLIRWTYRYAMEGSPS